MMYSGIACSERISEARFERLKDFAVREAFKWNISTLEDFAIVLSPELFSRLSELAIRLDREAHRAEAELVCRPFAMVGMGVPARLTRALRRVSSRSVRYARYDFHPCTDGSFAITEGNLDVAGGWNEAGAVALAFGQEVSRARHAGDPASALAAAMAQCVGEGGRVGVMHLVQYSDDRQVARYLASRFEAAGMSPLLFDPSQLRRAGERAGVMRGAATVPVDAVFRFFPADWVTRLRDADGWLEAAQAPETVWSNPLVSILSQSKRFPLFWPQLTFAPETWRTLLPDTRQATLLGSSNWVLKPSFGHEGHRIAVPGVTAPRECARLWRAARVQPFRWVAQRPFRASAVLTPSGLRFPCIGVYVVDGKVAGLYGRVAEAALINDRARDVVVLIGDA